MKKLMGFLIGIILIGLIGLGVYKGKEYYNDRYVGETYYIVVPENQSLELEKQYADNGEELGLGKEYKLIGYNKKGESKELEFTVRTDNPKDLFKRGTYLAVESSNQIVLGEKSIDKSEIPDNVLKLIEENK
ncbi:YxeA family protein [Miniphocaeibacter massiliensis]|uniref:YxeA family protein n=1 Tax=Miniphocaeibacter massiliensis TaxID=2041841 RepID=UPI000C1B8BB1|nr:YxeA family protein [Miniphocaeibacter massiliensis]